MDKEYTWSPSHDIKYTFHTASLNSYNKSCDQNRQCSHIK